MSNYMGDNKAHVAALNKLCRQIIEADELSYKARNGERLNITLYLGSLECEAVSSTFMCSGHLEFQGHTVMCVLEPLHSVVHIHNDLIPDKTNITGQWS